MVQPSQAIKEAKEKIVGLKQTLRAIQQDKIEIVYFASDLEDHIVRKISEQCGEKSIPIMPSNLTQKEMGRLCQIEVGASVIGLLK
jgi:large subunit ribosomal protein L7A